MKPIEKYRESFVALLRQAEEELGDCLTIKVSSRPAVGRCQDGTHYVSGQSREYEFELRTGSPVIWP